MSTSRLYWIPHSTQVWALAHEQSNGTYSVQSTVDSETSQENTEIVFLDTPSLQSLSSRFAPISGIDVLHL